MTTTATRTDFLAAIHADCEGVRELRALPSESRIFRPLDDDQAVSRFAEAHGDENVYVAIATRKNSTNGRLENCHQLPALLVDIDHKHISENDARARLMKFPLRPSAVVRTDGGEHVYWFFREPMMLPDEAEAARSLLRRLAQALGADLAAAEPARVLRLPDTSNYKYDPPRRVRIESLAVERRYNPSDFDDLLPPELTTTNGHGHAFTMPDEPLAEGEGRNNAIYRLIRALRAKNVKAKTIVAAVEAENARFKPSLPGDELHALLEHALTQPDRSDFIAPRNGQPPSTEPKTQPTIAVSGDLAAMTGAAWEALIAANEPALMFRRGSVPSRLEHGDDGGPMTRPLTPERMRHALARCSRWESTERTRKGERLVEVYPPVAVVLDMLATPDPPLPVLDRLVEVPVFTATGRLRTTPGYDPEGQTYFAPPPGLTIPAIAPHPTPAEVGAAAVFLAGELVGDFCFVTKSERAHALTVVLLPFLRELIEGPTPLHLIEASTPGTGKTLLVDVLLWPSLGRPVPAMTEGRDEDEWRKRISAKLLAASNVVFLDNLRRRLDSAAVSSAITAPAWEDRILGRSETQSVPVRCTWLASGNNPALSLEMTRRTVRIRLDAQCEEPWRRTGFRHPDLRAWSREHRGHLIAAALTLGQAWLDAGRPPGSTTLGMFEDWARVMGGVLDVAGVDGFLGNLDAFYADADLERAEIRAFLTAWWTAHAESRVTVADLLNLEPLPSRIIEGGKGREDRGLGRRLGRLLSALRDRHFRLPEGPTVRVERSGDARGGVSAWRLRSGEVR